MIFRVEKLTLILTEDEIETFEQLLLFVNDYDVKDKVLTKGERILLNELLEKFGDGQCAIHNK